MGVQCLVGKRFRCMWENGGPDSFYRSISLYFHVLSYVYVQLLLTCLCSSKHVQIQGKWNFQPYIKASWRHGHDQANGEIYARMSRDHSRPRYVWCSVVLRNELRAEIEVQCFIVIDVANEWIWARSCESETWGNGRLLTSPSSLSPPYPQLCSMKNWLNCSKAIRVSLLCKFVESWQQRNVGGTETYLML